MDLARAIMANVIRLRAASGIRRDDGFDRLRALLGPEQLALCDDPSALSAACTGRRAGKTTTFIGRAGRSWHRRPDARLIFVGPTIDDAVDILWDDLARWNKECELGMVEHWSDRQWTHGPGTLDFAGFATRKQADKLRGKKYHLVWIDEAQLGPSWFEYFVQESLLPTLLDFGGDVVMTGTPGIVADGLFFDAVTGSLWSNRHHWTARENPFFKGRDPFQELQDRLKLTPGTAAYKREWLGQWVVDPDALVYRIPDEVQVAKAGPWFKTVLGLDLGFNDNDALAAVGISQDRQTTHLRHAEQARGQTNAKLLARTKELAVHVGAREVVCDEGGLGKKIVETFRQECPGLTWIAAEKDRKLEHIELLNSDMAEGKHTVEPGNLVVKDALRVRWGNRGKIDEKGFHSDVCDAWLYPYRYARKLLRELPKEQQSRDKVMDEYFARLAREEQERRSPLRRMG